jgi:hypothetical protein
VQALVETAAAFDQGDSSKGHHTHGLSGTQSSWILLKNKSKRRMDSDD